MKAYRCDRCLEYVDGDHHDVIEDEIRAILTIVIRTPDGNSADAELCAACHSEMESMWHHEE